VCGGRYTKDRILFSTKLKLETNFFKTVIQCSLF
jgi:hypothetical protein